ncbi:chromosomal replication initiator protein DnaA [Atribacter laminatus]|uniref:Chromosomal replication initiator protein DnaA n=1 Tax=Atribacter laminatus TaxID=2847778 RepID=A0A7T1AKJ3_ATRLM|nr:chromosomal replication initiator protein DnaA [Atribacter laminatus]QPM67601.1 Chromosomal replication initiator protein DnaA [Atribacter laminatus]
MNDVSSTLDGLWIKTISFLEKQLSVPEYAAWIETIHPISFSDNELILGVPSSLAREKVEQKYLDLLRTTFSKTVGKDASDLKVILSVDSNSTISLSPSPILIPQSNDWEKPNLNPRYSFSSFVVGNSNKFAHAAAVAVAESPAKSYNPLFIYGGVGLGKTHLMHAIGHQVLKKNQSARIVYSSSEKFTNELINSIRDDKTEDFRQKYRNVDVLLIDDIQFLAGKERTQEEFFHTFNSLHDALKQIVLTSDRPPKEIPTLEDRLRSRFEWGLLADIQPPDLETRIAILRKKAETEHIDIPDEVILFIADRIPSNIRELEGALVRIKAYCTLNQISPNPEIAEEILKDILPKTVTKKISVSTIQRVVSEHYSIKPGLMRAKKRTREVAFPRQVAMYITRSLTNYSLPAIGEEFGGRDHTTVLHAYEKIKTDLENNPQLSQEISGIIEKIQREGS